VGIPYWIPTVTIPGAVQLEAHARFVEPKKHCRLLKELKLRNLACGARSSPKKETLTCIRLGYVVPETQPPIYRLGGASERSKTETLAKLHHKAISITIAIKAPL
jgi:hypothetical protein